MLKLIEQNKFCIIFIRHEMTPLPPNFGHDLDTGDYHRESLTPLSPSAQAELDREFGWIEPEDSAKRRKDTRRTRTMVEGGEKGPAVRSPSVQAAAPSSLMAARDDVSNRTPSPVATATITATGHGAIATATARGRGQGQVRGRGATAARSRKRVRAEPAPPPRRSRRRVVDQLQSSEA